MTIHDFTYTGGDSGVPYQVQQYDRLDRAVTQTQYYFDSVRDWRQDVVNYATQARKDRDHIQTLGDTIASTGQQIEEKFDTTVAAADTAVNARDTTITHATASQTARTGAETARDQAGNHATASATSASSAADILEANQALGITVDTSVGTRVSIGGEDIYYDSGWRDLRGLVDSDNWDFDFAASRFHLKRNLDTVELVLRVRIGPGYAGSSKNLTMTLMTGIHASFQQNPPSYGTLGVAISNREIFSATNSASSGGIYITGASEGSWELGQTLSLYTSWNTAASLPRSLPGTSA